MTASEVHQNDLNPRWLRSYPENVEWRQTFTPAPLYSLLDQAVSRFGTNTATNFLGRTITYAELGKLVERAAAGLQRLGVKKGTKVGLFLPNSPTFIVYYFATLKAGGVVVNFNPLYTIPELKYQIEDSETEIMVTLDLKLLFDKIETLLAENALKRVVVAPFASLLPGAKSVLFRLFKSKELANVSASSSGDKITLEGQVLADHGPRTPVPIDAENDVAVLQYTGGTTGTPKGAMLTHANAYINVLQVLAWAPDLVEGEEKVMGVLPFFHVFAMTVVMNFGVAKAAEIIIMPRFVLNDAMKLINKTLPTIMPGVPTLFNAILNHPDLKTFDLSSLKFCLSGGAALPVEVKQRFEALTGCKVVEGYGLSETSPVATCNPVDGPVRAGSIGIPLPATFLSLRDLDDPDKEVAQGEKGEICISGPQVMKGYWKRPDATAAAFTRDGFFRTGDVARMDESGFFSIEDRVKDLIICSGYNVYPRQIEERIYEHPAVDEVTVIGIEDEYRGEAPKAFIKVKDGAKVTADEIMAHLEKTLSKIELPAEIEFRDSLPKTMIGKLSKKELKDEESQRRAARKGH
ncbi:MAG: long-chain fatty acid--CoA ligase [Hyphomicrobiaceae bacterium]|nr:long-chain fatty acid--CoA ligase [Hyphomicrobiaceae bacterium]MCC0010139.1 long-chain fatty acid--CoA ligase [Hyphomicrobiaceae bacterium]